MARILALVLEGSGGNKERDVSREAVWLQRVTEEAGDDRFRFWLSAVTGGRDGEKNTGKVSIVDKWTCCSSGGKKSDGAECQKRLKSRRGSGEEASGGTWRHSVYISFLLRVEDAILRFTDSKSGVLAEKIHDSLKPASCAEWSQ